jgi:hypothetical protein
MKSLFFCMLMAVVGLAQLSGQVNPAEVTQKFQESAQLNDERVKVFLELEAKAALNDKKALGDVGRYYCAGSLSSSTSSRRTWHCRMMFWNWMPYEAVAGCFT